MEIKLPKVGLKISTLYTLAALALGGLILYLLSRKIMSLSNNAISYARSQIGVKEIGHNAGKQVNEYQVTTGNVSGAAWCMSFVYWCFQKAAKDQKTLNPLIRTGGVLDQWNRIPKQYKKSVPSVGSIFIMSTGGGFGHTGIITQVNNNGTFTAIEGNSNSNGSREGVEVCQNTRKINNSAILGYITI